MFLMRLQVFFIVDFPIFFDKFARILYIGIT